MEVGGIQNSLQNAQKANDLKYTRVNNSGISLGSTRLGTASLNASDNLLGLKIARNNLAEDNVLAVEPASDNGSDEEL